MLLRGLPGRRRCRAGEQRFDIAGALLLASGLASLLLAINALPRLRDGEMLALVLLPAACVSLVAFVWWEARTPQPVVQVALFRRAAFAVINAASCLLYLVTFSVMLISPYFLVHHTGLSLPQAGMVLASGFVAMALDLAAGGPDRGAVRGRADRAGRSAGDRGRAVLGRELAARDAPRC